MANRCIIYGCKLQAANARPEEASCSSLMSHVANAIVCHCETMSRSIATEDDRDDHRSVMAQEFGVDRDYCGRTFRALAYCFAHSCPKMRIRHASRIM